jgi:hypothetical protein
MPSWNKGAVNFEPEAFVEMFLEIPTRSNYEWWTSRVQYSGNGFSFQIK